MNTDLGLTIIVSTLTILLFIGLVALLLVVSHNRRNKHRVQVAELRAQHVEEVRTVEKEVMADTLTEVGRELHDNVGQVLTTSRIGLTALLEDFPGMLRLEEARGTLDLAIAEVRRLGRTLNTERWNTLPLGETIAQECARVERAGKIAVPFTRQGGEPVLSADEKIVLFRIFQEAVNNALKHAGATRISVELADGAAPRLTIADDGRGFDPADQDGAGEGLRNLRRRAELIGYHCEVTSAAGHGTTITLSRHGPEGRHPHRADR